MLMKKIMMPLIGLLFIALSAQAQKNEYTLSGYMGVQGGESFHYDLKLKDSVGNILSGYGYTYQNKENDVKTYVVATVDRANKTVQVKEVTILENNFFKSHATICLVEAILKYAATEKSLSGSLITITAGNGANCSKGSISFSNAAEIEQLFNPQSKTVAEKPVAIAPTPVVKTPVRKPVKVITDTASVQQKVVVPEPPKQTVITEGKDKTYEWKSEEIVFEIWDGNTVDNDKVNVLLNGNIVLKDYVLSKAPKQLKMPVGGNELNIISIEALNEGSEPPNTANIKLIDGNESYDVVAHNKFGKTALIKIKKKL